MSSAAFSRAHSQWLQPPEESPAFIEWYDAQEVKKGKYEYASLLLDEFGWEPVTDFDSFAESLKEIKSKLNKLYELQAELAELEDMFPVPYIDECPDDGE